VAEKDHELVDFVFDDVLGGILGADFDNKNGDKKTVRKIPTLSLATIFERFHVPHNVEYFIQS
jgi:hypothetical protein